MDEEILELSQLAVQLSESESRLELCFLDAALARRVQALIKDQAETELTETLDKLAEVHAEAYAVLAAMVEGQTESRTLYVRHQAHDVLLFACPVLSWSRYNIPTPQVPLPVLAHLKTLLAAHIFSAAAHITLVDHLLGPDQLPHYFCKIAAWTEELGQLALQGKDMPVSLEALPETQNFLSDIRYLIGAVVVPAAAPLFRWHEQKQDRHKAQATWIEAAGPHFSALFPGCHCQTLPVDGYHAACRQSDLAARAYAVQASVDFLTSSLPIQPEALQAIVAPCYGETLEEYRIGFSPVSSTVVYHGVVWSLLGMEDEQTDVPMQIEAALRAAGIQDILYLDDPCPLEACSDCGAPFFPDREGEMVHAEMPEQAESAHQTLH